MRLKIFKRIQNLIKDVHRKGAKYLCENSNVLFIPDFKSVSMVRKKRSYRWIRSKIAAYVESLLVQDTVESKSSGDGNGDRGSDGGVYHQDLHGMWICPPEARICQGF